MSFVVNKKRIQYIDALRGFTMLLVVLQHVELMSFGIEPYNSVLGNIFVSFRMPMFFFISGYIAYKASVIWDTSTFLRSVRKKAIVQLIPTAFFFSLFVLSLKGNPASSFWENGLGGYWFTFVLFEMFCIFYIVSLLPRKAFNWIVIGLSLFGIIALVLFRTDARWWNLLCLENLCKYMQFFTLGLLAKKYNDKWHNLISKEWLKTGIILCFIGCILILTTTTWGVESFVGKNVIRSIIVRYSGLFIVFSFFASKEEFFSRNNKLSKSLQFIGRRTLDIYLIHYFLIPVLPEFAEFVQANVVFELIVSLIVALLVVGISLLISEVIRSSEFLGHYLFGVKSDKYKI